MKYFIYNIYNVYYTYKYIQNSTKTKTIHFQWNPTWLIMFLIWILYPSSPSCLPFPTTDKLMRSYQGKAVQLVKIFIFFSVVFGLYIFSYVLIFLKINFWFFSAFLVHSLFHGVTLINGDIFIRRHAMFSIQSVDLQMNVIILYIYHQIQIYSNTNTSAQYSLLT